MNGIYLLLGTNLGDREANLGRACQLLIDRGILIIRKSGIYETAPWGIEEQPSFLNQVLEVSTDLKPQALLEEVLAMEMKMGRIRYKKWAERLIDIDILYYRDEIIDDKNLKIPHPFIQERRFTLWPLVELASDELHPVLMKTQQELLEICSDQLVVKVYK